MRAVQSFRTRTEFNFRILQTLRCEERPDHEYGVLWKSAGMVRTRLHVRLIKIKTDIWAFMSQTDQEKLIHAFISSRLDYCNGLLTGLPQKSTKQLQLIQNAAARVLTRTKRSEHITPVLKSLHWLPVQSRLLGATNVYHKRLFVALSQSYQLYQMTYVKRQKSCWKLKG